MNVSRAYAFSLVMVASQEVVSAGIVGVVGTPTENEVIDSIVRAALDAGTIDVGDEVDVALVYTHDDEDVLNESLENVETLGVLPASIGTDDEFLRACGIEREA